MKWGLNQYLDGNVYKAENHDGATNGLRMAPVLALEGKLFLAEKVTDEEDQRDTCNHVAKGHKRLAKECNEKDGYKSDYLPSNIEEVSCFLGEVVKEDITLHLIKIISSP